MDKTLKEKNDAWTDTDEHTEIPFRKRVQNFWKWFTDNEKKLSQIVENRGSRIVEMRWSLSRPEQI